MIPLRDDIVRRGVPRATLLVIAIAVCVYGYELYLHFALQALEPWIREWGLVPRDFLHALEKPQVLATPLTSLFLHGGHTHLLGNLLYLWIFGASVESALGTSRFLIFYFVCGFAASMIQVASAPDSLLPTVGASGAISGVLGAYLRLHPKGKLELFLIPVRVPALLFLVLWFALQVVSGLEAGGVDLHALPTPAFQSDLRQNSLPSVQSTQGLQTQRGVQASTLARAATAQSPSEDVKAGSSTKRAAEGSAPTENSTALVAWWAHIGGFLAGFSLANAMRLDTVGSSPRPTRSRSARPRRRR